MRSARFSTVNGRYISGRFRSSSPDSPCRCTTPTIWNASSARFHGALRSAGMRTSRPIAAPSGKVPADERLVHHDAVRPRVHLLPVEEASLQQRDAHHVEIVLVGLLHQHPAAVRLGTAHRDHRPARREDRRQSRIDPRGEHARDGRGFAAARPAAAPRGARDSDSAGRRPECAASGSGRDESRDSRPGSKSACGSSGSRPPAASRRARPPPTTRALRSTRCRVPPTVPRPASLQRCQDVASRKMQCRRQAEQQCRRDRNAQREQQHRHVQRDLRFVGDGIRRHHRDDAAQSRGADRHAQQRRRRSPAAGSPPATGGRSGIAARPWRRASPSRAAGTARATAAGWTR